MTHDSEVSNEPRTHHTASTILADCERQQSQGLFALFRAAFSPIPRLARDFFSGSFKISQHIAHTANGADWNEHFSESFICRQLVRHYRRISMQRHPNELCDHLEKLAFWTRCAWLIPISNGHSSYESKCQRKVFHRSTTFFFLHKNVFIFFRWLYPSDRFALPEYKWYFSFEPTFAISQPSICLGSFQFNSLADFCVLGAPSSLFRSKYPPNNHLTPIEYWHAMKTPFPPSSPLC